MPRNVPSPHCLATGVGALPHADPTAACNLVLSIFPKFPFIPTLPNRGVFEQIVFNDSENLPGRTIIDQRLTVDTTVDYAPEVEKIYQDYLEGNYVPYAAGKNYASAFHEMMKFRLSNTLVLKCQITGPVTFGMQVTDCERRPIFYNPQFADVLGKLIGLRARWFEEEMHQKTGVTETLIVLNEPYLSSLGSLVVPVDPDMARSAIVDSSALLTGGYGIHCCANTDWEFLLEMQPAVLSIDAYTTAKEFLLYGSSIGSFLEKGGIVAWGIVPAEYQVFSKESCSSLFQRFEGIKKQVCEYVSPHIFSAQSLITPTCGLRFTNEKEAAEIMQLTALLSHKIRRTFL